MEEKGNILIGNKGKIKEDNIVLSDSYKDHNGCTVYQRGVDNGDGSYTLALAYLGADEQIQESLSPFKSANQELGSITYSTDTNASIRELPSRIPTEEYESMKLAWQLYHKFKIGPIRTYCNTMTHIAMDGLMHEVDETLPLEDRKFYKEFFDTLFFENLQIANTVQNILLNLFVCNNAFVWTKEAPYTPRYMKDLKEISVKELKERSELKGKNIACLINEKERIAVYSDLHERFLNEQELLEYAAKKNEWSKKKIPSIITTLCTTSVSVEQSMDNLLERYYNVMVKDNVANILLRNQSITNIDNKNLNINFDVTTKQIRIPAEEISHLSIFREDWQMYGEPDTLAALEPIYRKIKKIEVEDKAVQKLVRCIVLVTVGDEKTPATVKQLRAAASLFNQGTVFTIVWNHTMKIQIISQKELTDMLKPDTYEEMDEDIWEALGYPIFMSGRSSDTNFAIGTYLLRLIVHKIATARRVILDNFLLPKYRKTQRQMGFPKDCVVPAFNRYILEDLNLLAKRIMSYFDSNLISGKRAYENLPDGFKDWENELNLLREQHEDVEAGILGRSTKKADMGRPEGTESDGPVVKQKTSPKGDGDRPNQKMKSSKEELVKDFMQHIERSNTSEF